MSVLCHVCGGQLEVVEFCLQCSPPQDEPLPDPTPAALDLVVEARVKHPIQHFEKLDWCQECRTKWPCLVTRLADALEQAQRESERLELQLFNCVDGPHTGHRYTNGITGAVTYCCPAHQDGYTWLDAARADAVEQRARAERIETAYRDLTHSEMCGFACGCDAAVAAALAPPEHRRG